MKKLFLIAVFMLLFVFTNAAAELNNVTSEGVDGNLVFYDASKNEIMTLDATNRRLSIPSGSSLYSSATGITLRGVTYTLPSADGTNGQQLTTNGSATLSWASPGSSTAWDDISSPDANKTHAFTTFTSTFTGTSTAADQWNFQGVGAFGDVSVMRVEQKTGNPTDGTVLEVVAADTDVDPLLVTANSINVIKVNGAGTLSLIGNTDLTGDLAITGGLSLTGSFYQSAIAAAATGNTALTVDASGNGTITIGGTSTGNTIFPGVVVANGNVDIGNAATDTLSITSIIDSNVTLDDGATDSPSLIFKDATDQTVTIYKVDGGDLSVTLGAVTGSLYIPSGNLKVGNGSPGTAAMNGDDAYIKGQLEVDGAIQFDGALTVAAATTLSDTVAINGAPTITNVEASYTTNADDQFAFSRNQGTTTKPLVAITTSAASDDAAALAITSGSTAGVDAATISYGGTASTLHPTTTAAASTVFDVDVANSMTGRVLYGDLGPWLGTSGQGAIELVTDSAATVAAGQLLRLNQQGSGQHAAAIDGSVIYIADAATAPGAGTSYAVTIAPTNIASLHLTKAAQLDTTMTVTGLTTATGGITANEDVLVSLDANDEEVTIQNSAADMGANTAMLVVKGTAGAGQTNASYLLSLDRNADGDAQDNFIVMRDNAYTDVKFKVDADGATTIAGLLTLNAGTTITGATNMTAAVLSGASPLILDGSTADATNRVTVAVTDPTAARTLTVPDATGTLKLNCTATHDYGAGAADWNMTGAESQCSFITVSNANGACQAHLSAAISGQVYTVYNNSGQTLTLKVEGGTGATIATGKYALYAAGASDVFEVFEQP